MTARKLIRPAAVIALLGSALFLEPFIVSAEASRFFKTNNQTNRRPDYDKPANTPAPRVAKSARAPRKLLFRIPVHGSYHCGPWEGYLASLGPLPLRFSEESANELRPPSPALMELSVISKEYDPYLIESSLPDGFASAPGLLDERVVELEPFKMVSGITITSVSSGDDANSGVAIEANQESFLKPEEVLIYFESKGSGNGSKAIIPFSPAVPTQNPPPSRSAATFIKE